jgi:energy-coupling factor transport system ATP-binding protein
MYEIGPFTYFFKKTNSKSIVCPQKIKITDGEFILITGPSGGGKSTFLQMLKGIIPEYGTGVFEGALIYNGHPLTGKFFQENLKKILFLFQNPFSQLIYPWASDEFYFSMENDNYTREQMDKKREELQNYFDLGSVWHKKTSTLSHGECQRLVLASLLAIGPEVLLLDEPTAFLDPEARSFFYQWLSTHKNGKTIILVDHHLKEIIQYIDRVIHVSADGEISETFPIIDKSEKKREQSFSFLHEIMKPTFVELVMKNVSYHHAHQEKLLEDLSLSARSGDVIVIKGKNGQGKSTLFKIMAGLIRPNKGEVQIQKEGQSLVPKKRYKEMGFIFQNPETHFFYDTIKEELSEKLTKIPEKKLEDLLIQFFKNIDVGRSPFLLSEGEKRRLSLLMTVFQNKNILFYDEPTFGQDSGSITVIRDLMLELKAMGKIQFIISHDEDFIKSLDAKVYLLKDCHLEKV